ncbi:MAG: MoaD/ThiS family protein [Chloroflexota bacterium]|nr:MoaD/ThiS family protein [Chloroflexota bacterium]
MPTVFIPTMLLPITDGVKQLRVESLSVRQIIDDLDQLYPGLKDRLIDAGSLKSNVAVSVDGEIAILGLLEKVADESEIHFVPAIGGGISEIDWH